MWSRIVESTTKNTKSTGNIGYQTSTASNSIVSNTLQSTASTKCPVPESSSAVIVVAALGWTLFLALAFVVLVRIVRERKRSSRRGRGNRGSQARMRTSTEPSPKIVKFKCKGSKKNGIGTPSSVETRPEGNAPERQHEAFPPIGLGLGPNFIFASERDDFEPNLSTGRFSNKGALGNLSVVDGTNKQTDWNRYADDQQAQPYPSLQTSGLNMSRTNQMNEDDGEYSVPKGPAAAVGELDDDYQNMFPQKNRATSTSKSKPLPSLPPKDCAGAPAEGSGGAPESSSIITSGPNTGPRFNKDEGAVVNEVVVQVPPLPAKPENEPDYENFQRKDPPAAKKSTNISRKSSFKRFKQIFQP